MASRADNTTRIQVLLDLARNGDGGAYDELIERAADRLLRLCRKMLRSSSRLRRWEETDDVFQTAALKLHRSLKAVQPNSAAAFWRLAATQIRRTLVDLARHHFGPLGQAARHQTGAGAADGGGAALIENAPDRRTSEPESLEAWARFHEAIEGLPAEEREVFDLVWYGESTQKDAAEVLGVAERTVLRRLQRARLLIQERLQGE